MHLHTSCLLYTSSDDITISNGSDLTYASVEGKGIKASVKDTVDVAPEEMVELKELKIEPAVGDNIGAIIKTDGKLKLKLSNGFEFAGKKTDLKFSVGNPCLLYTSYHRYRDFHHRYFPGT